MPKFRFDDSALSLLKEFDAQILKSSSASKTKRASTRGRTKLTSEQYGCLPHEVALANECCKKMNIAVEYQPDGSIHYGGPEAERKHRRAIENSIAGNV